MTRLQRRVKKHRRRMSVVNIMKIRLKKCFMKALALSVIVLMLFSMVKMPTTYAYFTAETESAGFEFLIHRVEESSSTDASIALLDKPFLFEEAEEGAGVDGEASALTDADLTRSGTLIAAEDSLDSSGQESTPLMQPSPGETLDVEIAIFTEGLRVEEIFIPSVKLHYGEKVAFALKGEIVNSALLATFDLCEIWGWFLGSPSVPETIIMDVSGEGYQKDSSVFFFTGEAEIQLKGTYDVKEIQIVSPDVLFIAEGETRTHLLTLADQEGEPLTGATWSLISPPRGVFLDELTGMLQAGPEHIGEILQVKAALESQGRLHTAEKEIALHPRPQLEILGLSSITVPLPGESLQELYQLSISHDYRAEEMQWDIFPAHLPGLHLDDQGLVTISGEAPEGSFTLTARVLILGTEFHAEKEVALEVIQIGSLSIAGEEYLTVPDYEPLTAYYTAIVLDPHGEELPGEPVSWEIYPREVAGIYLDPDGQLIIEPAAESTEVVLQALSVRDPSCYATFTVTVQKEEPYADESSSTPEEVVNPDEDGFSVAAQLYLEDVPTVIIIPCPDSGEPSLEYQLSAVLLDQEGNPMEAQVSWVLEGEPPGVALGGGGLLTITSEAEEGTVTVTASAEGITASASIDLLPPQTAPAEDSADEGAGDKEEGDSEAPDNKDPEDPVAKEETPEAEAETPEDSKDPDEGSHEDSVEGSGGDETSGDDEGGKDPAEPDTGGQESSGGIIEEESKETEEKETQQEADESIALEPEEKAVLEPED